MLRIHTAECCVIVCAGHGHCINIPSIKYFLFCRHYVAVLVALILSHSWYNCASMVLSSFRLCSVNLRRAIRPFILLPLCKHASTLSRISCNICVCVYIYCAVLVASSLCRLATATWRFRAIHFILFIYHILLFTKDTLCVTLFM